MKNSEKIKGLGDCSQHMVNCFNVVTLVIRWVTKDLTRFKLTSLGESQSPPSLLDHWNSYLYQKLCASAKDKYTTIRTLAVEWFTRIHLKGHRPESGTVESSFPNGHGITSFCRLQKSTKLSIHKALEAENITSVKYQISCPIFMIFNKLFLSSG